MRLRVQTLSRFAAGAIAMLFLATAGTMGQTQPPPLTEQPANTGTITGRVVNESGQGLPNASVSAQPVGFPAQVHRASTDHEGNFKFTGLERGQWALSASMPAYMPARPAPDNPRRNQYQIGDSATLMLAKGGVITGKVTTAEGEPVIAIGVRLEVSRDGSGRRSSGTFFREKATDDRGVYRIYGLPPGTYKVAAGGGGHDYSHRGINPYASNVPTYAPSSTRDTAAEITLREGEEITEVDIRYRGEPGRVISGVARGPARAETGFNVTLTAIGEGNSQTNSSTFQPPGTEEFVFNGVPDGDYYLTAQSTSEKNETAISESKLIKVRGADVTGIELVTQPLGSVSGRVVMEETKVVECIDKTRPVFTETALAAAHKREDATKDRAQFIWRMAGPVYADAQGNVTLRNLVAGDYRFAVRVSAKDWYLQSIFFAPSATRTPPGKPIDATKTWTRIKPGDRLSGLTVTLVQGAASLRGQVAPREGETVPEKLFVYLAPVEREKADDVLRYYAAAVGPNGAFQLNNLAPGRYWILAQPLTDAAEVMKTQLPDEREARVRVRRAAEAAKTEIEFKPCQHVVDFRLKTTAAP